MKKIGIVALVLYVVSIPAANWMIQHIGTQYAPGAPHVIQVGFGLEAPSGVLMIGLALVMRDVVQRAFGRWWAVGAIAIGAALSFFVAPSLALASGIAFLLGELADFAVYTPLERRHLYAAVLLSGLVGAVLDSLIFLQMAFGSTDFWQGNALGKVWLSLAALPVMFGVRRALPEHATN